MHFPCQSKLDFILSLSLMLFNKMTLNRAPRSLRRAQHYLFFTA